MYQDIGKTPKAPTTLCFTNNFCLLICGNLNNYVSQVKITNTSNQ